MLKHRAESKSGYPTRTRNGSSALQSPALQRLKLSQKAAIHYRGGKSAPAQNKTYNKRNIKQWWRESSIIAVVLAISGPRWRDITVSKPPPSQTSRQDWRRVKTIDHHPMIKAPHLGYWYRPLSVDHREEAPRFIWRINNCSAWSNPLLITTG